MAATSGIETETCGSCCLKLKDLIKSYENQLGLSGDNTEGTKIHLFGSVNFCLEHNKFTNLVNSIRSKCVQCKSWPDAKKDREKAIKASLERYQMTENLAPVRSCIKECLDKLQHAMKDNSIKGVVQRLEAITRKVGLKFYDNGTGTDCFISSDMFYVEVKMDTNGKVSEVKVAHAGDPEGCPELTKVLREGDYVEFACHLKGLSDLYQLSGDTFQKSKILMALKAVEIDLSMISDLFGSSENSTDAIMRCPVGFSTPRQGGRLMRLTYFASPYDLLDKNNPGSNLQFSKECHPPIDLGCWVSVSVEQSQKCLLPTMPLIEEPMMSGMLDENVIIKYQPLNDNNSDELPASFVLELNKPMPVAVEGVQKIYSSIHKTGSFVHSSKVPIHNLVINEWLKLKGISDDEGKPAVFYAAIPDHYHTYYLNTDDSESDEVTDVSSHGIVVHRIPITHPCHVPAIVKQLRRQATYNTLLTSALRAHRPPPRGQGRTEHLFELSTPGTYAITITFAHPCTTGMASIDFEVTEDSSIQASLHTVPGQPLFCTNKYLSNVTQRCLSIPATMRCLIRKAQSFKPEELPVKATETKVLTPSLTTSTQPSVKLDKLNIPGNPFFTPSGPNTPGFFTASPTFASLALETPSPTLGAFPFSISPTMSSFSFTGAEVGAMNLEAANIKHEKKLETPKPPSTPKLTLTLKRKRADEYVVKDFQMPDDVPQTEKPKTLGEPSDTSAKVPGSAMEVDGPRMLSEGMLDNVGSNFDSGFMLGQGFGDVGGGDPRAELSSVASGMSAMAASTALGHMARHVEGVGAGADLFDMTSGGSDTGDLEGILQSLPGASHLPPGIVSGGGLDFGSGLGPGVHGMEVDSNFDIDAAIDANTSSDPSIAGVVASAGAFDVDSALDFDLDHITGSVGPGDPSGDGGVLPEGLLSPDDVIVMESGMGSHTD